MKKEMIAVISILVLLLGVSVVIAEEKINVKRTEIVLNKVEKSFELNGNMDSKVFLVGEKKYEIQLISSSDSPSTTVKILKDGQEIAVKELNKGNAEIKIENVELKLISAGLGRDGKGNLVNPSAAFKIKINEKTEKTDKEDKISAQKIILSESNSEAAVIKEGKKFIIALVSASDESATLKVSDQNGNSEMKEVKEGKEMTLLGLAIILEDSDENNSAIKAEILVKEASASPAAVQAAQAAANSRAEKLDELKNQASALISSVKSRVESISQGNQSQKTEIAVRQANQLIQEAEKLFENGNYAAAIAVSKTAGARLELSQGELIDKIERNLEERGQKLKEREKKIQEWEDKLNKRIEKIESRLKELERFERIIEKREGKLNVNGESITIKEISKKRKEIIASKINAKLGLNITGEEIDDNVTTIAALLSNGKLAPVKIMPDKASLTALKKLKAKCEKEGCTIELKEVGNFENVRPVYVIETEKDSRLLFIFPKKMAVRAEVDAETGEVINVKKPWWSFSAKEKNAQESEIEADVGISK